MTRNNSIYGMYFSGTGTTEKIVTRIAGRLAEELVEASAAEPA